MDYAEKCAICCYTPEVTHKMIKKMSFLEQFYLFLEQTVYVR